jgi:MinD superfamily P-loop ATPase
MKQLLVISGKGGTGKTSLSGAFAALAAPLVLVDCDVDAANLYLLAGAQGASAEEEPFISGHVAQVNAQRCTGCGACAGLCRFGAVTIEPSADGKALARISALACEGCGVCADNCPAAAIRLEDRLAGSLLSTETRFGPLAYGELLAGQPNSGKLVATVRSRAKALAEARGYDLVLVDGHRFPEWHRPSGCRRGTHRLSDPRHGARVEAV